MSIIRRVARNVKRWRNGEMIRRWARLGLMRVTERFRRIKGHDKLDALVVALRGEKAEEHAA